MSNKKYPPGHYDILHFRLLESQKSTISWFMIEGTEIKGYFLEPPGPSTAESRQNQRILPGRYNLCWHNGNKYKNVLKLYNSDLPVSRAILIHTGNYPENTRGCLLPGTTCGADKVMNSVKMLGEILEFVRQVDVKNVQLVISDEDVEHVNAL